MTGFYQHYSLTGTKMATIAELGGIVIPLEGSLPINSMGGGIGYQWVMKSGFRISAGIQVAYLKTNADGLQLMGMSGTEVTQNVNVPLIENRSVIIPMPELSIGWSF